MSYTAFDEALVGTIKIEDITPNEQNRNILQCLKDNDTLLDNEAFDKMWIIDDEGTDGDPRDYIPNSGEDIGWLGYFLGKNTSLMELDIICSGVDYTETFYIGLSCNRTIRTIYLGGMHGMHLSDGQALQMLDQFFKGNESLRDFEVDDCGFQAAGIRQVSLSIGNCKSLKNIHISNCTSGGGLVDIITALSMHPQLTELYLSDNETNIGRNELMALSTLLRCTTTQLLKLYLQNNNIDDEGVKELVNVLSNGNQLKQLDLSQNRSITIKGWKTLSTLLENPSCKLVELKISTNRNIGDDGALAFAEALTNNFTLEIIHLEGCGITDEGWLPFSKLLCDTPSVNKTYHSNHTLQDVGNVGRFPNDIRSNLKLNKSENKGEVAMGKIIRNHPHFNMNPFFEWELKVLPLIIKWFEKAATYTTNNHQWTLITPIKQRKLSAMNDFIREFPMQYVESMTRREIEEYTALEERLQGDKSQQEKLEEIRQRKAHALMRLT